MQIVICIHLLQEFSWLHYTSWFWIEKEKGKHPSIEILTELLCNFNFISRGFLDILQIQQNCILPTDGFARRMAASSGA